MFRRAKSEVAGTLIRRGLGPVVLNTCTAGELIAAPSKNPRILLSLQPRAALASGDHLPLELREGERAETLTHHTTDRGKLIDRSAWAAAARLLPVGWAALQPQLFASMAILGSGREHDVPSWGENFKERGEEKKTNDMGRALRIVFFPHAAVLAFQFGQALTRYQQRRFRPPKLNCLICTVGVRSSPEYSVLACMFVPISSAPCSLTAISP